MPRHIRALCIVSTLATISLPGYCAGNAAKGKTVEASPSLSTVSDREVKQTFSGSKYKKQVRHLDWNPKKGWNGLVPGISTLDDATKKFGPMKLSEDRAGESQYTSDAPVRLWIDDERKTIKSIEVYVADKFVEGTPATVRDAKIMYGPLVDKKAAPGCTIETTLERPGLRINSQSLKPDARITSLLFVLAKDEK